MEVERMHSLGIAFKSIRDNLVPMAILWLLAALTVWCYYRLPGFPSASGSRSHVLLAQFRQ